MSGSRLAKRRYYDKNREACIERSRLWRVNNPVKYTEHMQKSQVKLKVNPERKSNVRNYHLNRNFGIGLLEYNTLLENQNGCCAVCGKHHSEFDKSLAVDHNKDTKEIRGLLCFYCNFKLVADHTDGVLLRKIADYVESGTGWFIPDA